MTKWLKVDSSMLMLCPSYPASPTTSRQGTTYPHSALTSCDWLPGQTNRKDTSSFLMTNRLTGIRTHYLRCNHGRLNRLTEVHRNLTASQVRQTVQGCFTFHFWVFLFLPGTLFTVSLGLPQSKNNHSKSNLSGSMSKKKKDWKTEKGKACFGAIIITMVNGM